MPRLGTKVAICYRRDDAPGTSARIFERLREEHGLDEVFIDFDGIAPGELFRDRLERTLANCSVLLAVIGPNWIGRREGKPPRITDKNDWVRIEIETALKREITVVPVLVDNAVLPNEDDLPEELQTLVQRQAFRVDNGHDFQSHIKRLAQSINRNKGNVGLGGLSVSGPNNLRPILTILKRLSLAIVIFITILAAIGFIFP